MIHWLADTTGTGSGAISRGSRETGPGLRLPGPGVFDSTHQTRNKRSKARVRLSHSRSVLALAIIPSRVASLARTHATFTPGSVSAGGVSGSGMGAGLAVRSASAAFRAAMERAAIKRAFSGVKRTDLRLHHAGVGASGHRVSKSPGEFPRTGGRTKERQDGRWPRMGITKVLQYRKDIERIGGLPKTSAS